MPVHPIENLRVVHSANTRVVLPADHGVSGSAVEDSYAVHTLIENLLIADKRKVDGQHLDQDNQPYDFRLNGLKMDL